MTESPSSRGDHTRLTLVRAATRIIGQVGFDAASTRAIAQEAGANQALINYHFGGKEGLYQAVIASISEVMEASLVPVLDELASAAPLSVANARQAILHIFDTMLEQFSREEMHDWSRIIAREQQDPTPAFEIIYDRFMSRILDLLASLIAAASDGQVAGEAARTRATLFVGQVLVFVYAPAATQRFLGWQQLGDERKQQILAQLQQIVFSQFPEVTS